MRESQTLERVVQDDPGELENRIEQIHRHLRSDDPHERMDAGRAFRAAEENPTVLEPHLETLVDLLSDQNGSLQLSGAIGIAALAETTPETVAGTVPELISLLQDTNAPSIEIAVIRALTRIGEDSPDVIADTDTDRAVADLLRTATPMIRRGIVTIFASVVIENPLQFPETVYAMEDALDDKSARVRRYAAAAIALVATTDQSALSSVERVRDRVEELEAQVQAYPWHHDENVEQAAHTLRSLDV